MFDDDGFVSIEECSRRMGITPEQVLDLIERHALRAYRWAGWGEVMCEPAITNAITATPRRAGESPTRGEKARRRVAKDAVARRSA